MLSFRFEPPRTTLSIVILLIAPTILRAQPPGRPPAPVVVAEVIQKDFAAGKDFVGTVEPRYQASVGTAVAGRVTDVMVEEGDAVKEGQGLVQLLTDTIELELASARAELELRKQEMLELKNGARREELAQAKAAVLSAQALMKYQQRRRDRLQDLASERAVSREEVDEADSAATAAEQRLKESIANLDLVMAGPREEKIAQAAARVDMQQAVVDRLEDQIKKHTIISRFDGYVTKKLVERGQWVQQGDPAIEVVALDEVDVVVPLSEEFVSFVKIGDIVPVFVASAPNEILEGAVVSVTPQADPRARTFPVKVRVANKTLRNGLALRAGMLARVSLPTSHEQPCLLVPKDAVVLGGPSPVVYVVRVSKRGDEETTQVAPASVELGLAHGDLIEVRGAVKPGDRVVVKGNERLRPGQPVQIMPSKALPKENMQDQAASK